MSVLVLGHTCTRMQDWRSWCWQVPFTHNVHRGRHDASTLHGAHPVVLCVHTETPKVSLSYCFFLKCQTVSDCLPDTARTVSLCLIFRKLAQKCSVIRKGAMQRKGWMRDRVWQERGEKESPAGGRKREIHENDTSCLCVGHRRPSLQHTWQPCHTHLQSLY